MVDVLKCVGDRDDHCCYLNGNVCQWLEEGTVPGRRWACGLLRDNDFDWGAMATDPRYEPIGRHWQSISQDFNYCETFNPSFCCRPEFRFGRRTEQHEPRLDLIGVTDGDLG